MNQLNKNTIITYLRENKQFLQQEFGVTAIALFESYARNQAKRDSDIDILVKISIVNRSRFENYYLLKEHLEKEFLKEVDLGYFDRVREMIREEIEKDLIYA